VLVALNGTFHRPEVLSATLNRDAFYDITCRLQIPATPDSGRFFHTKSHFLINSSTPNLVVKIVKKCSLYTVLSGIICKRYRYNKFNY
jgi:hypothetical protein